MIPREFNISQNVLHTGSVAPVFSRVLVLGLLLVASTGVVTVTYELGLFDALLNQLSIFRVRVVRIEAEPPLDEATVRSWLPKLSDRTLLTLRAKTIVATIAGKPWVKTVTVRKVFPETVDIQVTATAPMALGVIKGESFFLAPDGEVIDRASQKNWGEVIPIISRPESSDWTSSQWVAVVGAMPDPWRSNISEYVFERYPYYRIYLASPKWNVALSAENWPTQLPHLATLIHNATNQLREVRHINLEILKKAVVRRPISK